MANPNRTIGPAKLPPMDTEDMFHLLAEVAAGVPAAKSALPDNPTTRAWRTQLTKEVAAIRAKGGEVDVPNEWQSAVPANPQHPANR